MRRPRIPAAPISQSSDTFHRMSTMKDAAAMAIVQRSVNARTASTYAAPAMAPVAAAETPSTNALICGCDRCRLKVRRGDDDEDIYREEHAKRRDRHAPGSTDEISDERDRDDDRTGRDHRHGDRVEELRSFSHPSDCTSSP